MKTTHVAIVNVSSSSSKYSRQVLSETPARALAFLATVGMNGEIGAALTACGYTAEDHRHGWALLNKITGQNAPLAPPAPEVRVAEAAASVEVWNEKNVRRLRAALERLHPEQGGFLFENIEPTRGPQAVSMVAVVLRRLDALESSSDRKGTHKEDHAALATLAKRGVTKTERARLRALVELAESPPAAVMESPDEIASVQGDMIALRDWYNDWAESARAVITSRNDLIRLGLAKRKSKKTPVPPPVVVGTQTPAPVVVPAPVIAEPVLQAAE